MLVALLAEKADIQYDSELTDPSVLVDEIQSLGFGATLLSDSEGYQQGKIDVIVSMTVITPIEPVTSPLLLYTCHVIRNA